MSNPFNPNSLVSFISRQPWGNSVLRHINDARCRWWDQVHDTDTCGIIPLSTVSFQSRNKDAGLEYSSHHPRIIRAALASLPISHQRYTFIDLGCGKGRVLLLASELPFRRILGIEFAPALAEIARHNLQRCRWQRQRCRDITVMTADATEYELPLDREVLYLANPFLPAVMSQVINNIERSFQRLPRDLHILFVGLQFRRDSSFGAHPNYERLLRERYFDLYRHRPIEAPRMPQAA
jgi:SAM-dependent methyltransferase